MRQSRAGETRYGSNRLGMGFKRVIGDLRELRRGVSELFETDVAAEEEASYALAASAYRFSQNTKEVVDDKLTFSATLMRAGEVSAANRLLEEFEHEVREEEAALIETVNEVKVAQSVRRERVTRVRLAKMLAVAAIGSALLTFSAAGMALAGLLQDLTQDSSEIHDDDAIRLATNGDAAAATGHISRKSLRRLRIGEVDVMLTKSQFQRLKALTGGGDIHQDALDEILRLLPAPLAMQIEEAITVAQAEVGEVSTKLENVALEAPRVESKKKRASKAADDASEDTESDPEPTPDPTPEPSESDDDKQGGSKEEGGDNKGEEEGDAGGNDPLPIDP